MHTQSLRKKDLILINVCNIFNKALIPHRKLNTLDINWHQVGTLKPVRHTRRKLCEQSIGSYISINGTRPLYFPCSIIYVIRWVIIF